MSDHETGQPWTREQIERLANGETRAAEIYMALLRHILQRYRYVASPARLARILWLAKMEAAVAMRDNARPEYREPWVKFVQGLQTEEPPKVPDVREPDYSAWMPA